MGAYSCLAALGGSTYEASAVIGAESLELNLGTRTEQISFADILDWRLIRYHLFLETTDGTVELSQLGFKTEDFFNNLWLAYNQRSMASLFAEGNAALHSEGDYHYIEAETERKSIAKLELFPDCLCILPHDDGARRVPLCFVEDLQRLNFSLNIRLDTGEQYCIARLGRDTEPFFGKLTDLCGKTKAAWLQAHAELEQTLERRLGEQADRLAALRQTGQTIVSGLFSPQAEQFWYGAIGGGRAAIELCTGDQTAIYLYRYTVSDAEFLAGLRHAMEAVGTHRELIFLEESQLQQNPLYRMSVARSRHVRFLRSCSAGRIIHSGTWQTQLQNFFA